MLMLMLNVDVDVDADADTRSKQQSSECLLQIGTLQARSEGLRRSSQERFDSSTRVSHQRFVFSRFLLNDT